MSTPLAQQAVVEYHREMAQAGHHGGHDMFRFHRDWHAQNPDPVPPPAPNRAWGADLVFGTNFLQMHHEMVKAADNEPKFHMPHQSLVSWYAAKSYALPGEWDPAATIPPVLAYDPDLSVFPPETQAAVRRRADDLGIAPEEFLRRRTDRPGFVLPRWATRDGVGPDEPGERYTGARKLADFLNSNQLGCCLVFPHNAWHVAIGGAMSSTATAIADPVFYFGVHWHMDRVFDEYKLIQAEIGIRAFDRRAVSAGAAPTANLRVPGRFSPEQAEERERDIANSRALRGLPEPPAPRRPPRGAVGGPRRPRAAAAARTRALGKRPAINALMAVPPQEHDLTWLKQALQRAVELELTTIPPYLCALWSIKTGGAEVRQRIRRVVLDEMFHLGLACNLLNAVGGVPELNTREAVPTYPGPLPGNVHPGLTISLEGLAPDKKLIREVFMEIEKPDWDPIGPRAAVEQYPTIGSFYAAIQGSFDRPDIVLTGERQLEYDARLFAIRTKDDVRRAIDRIRQQGEGTTGSPLAGPGTDLAHFYKFAEVWFGKRFQLTPEGKWDYVGPPVPFPTEVYPMARVPKGGYNTPEARAFDDLFTQLLNTLHGAWRDGNQAALAEAIDVQMYGLQGPAQQLMDTPLPGGGGNYGPCFRLSAS
jgi:Ferritin-like/Common central domain of tyrosinase